jgi:hypothetical protein
MKPVNETLKLKIPKNNLVKFTICKLLSQARRRQSLPRANGWMHPKQPFGRGFTSQLKTPASGLVAAGL